MNTNPSNAETGPGSDASPVPASVDPATIPGPHAANLGDVANGRLSAAEQRMVLRHMSPMAPGYALADLLADVERIVREHTERAWDEGFRAGWEECRDPGPFVNDWWDSQTPNPYRAARQEQNR